MQRMKTCMTSDESGAAAIELVLVIPIIILFAAAILDFGLLVKCNIALDSAATAAVRYRMDNPEKQRGAEDVKAYLKAIDPSLAGVEVRLTEGNVRREAYDHLFYIDETETVIPRKSYCSTQPFSIELAYRGKFKTLIGRGISLAAGGDGSLTASNVKSGSLDRTDGDTW